MRILTTCAEGLLPPPGEVCLVDPRFFLQRWLSEATEEQLEDLLNATHSDGWLDQGTEAPSTLLPGLFWTIERGKVYALRTASRMRLLWEASDHQGYPVAKGTILPVHGLVVYEGGKSIVLPNDMLSSAPERGRNAELIYEP